VVDDSSDLDSRPRSDRVVVPVDHPSRIMAAALPAGTDPASALGRMITKDSLGRYRVIESNGYGEVISISPPLKSREPH